MLLLNDYIFLFRLRQPAHIIEEKEIEGKTHTTRKKFPAKKLKNL